MFQRFTYYPNSIILAIIPLLFLAFLFGFITLFIAVAGTQKVMMSLIFGFILWSILLLLHRRFFVFITFYEDHILYKSLFKEIKIEYKNIKDLAYFSVRKSVKFAPYSMVNEAPFLSNFILIGDINEYPEFRYFTLSKPVSTIAGETYITIKYRKEMDNTLRILNKKLEQDL